MPQVPQQVVPARMPLWQYKVLTQKDRWFSGKFDPERLEQALNAFAHDGWQSIVGATATIPGIGSREEMVSYWDAVSEYLLAGISGQVVNGVFLTEGAPPGGQFVRRVAVEISRQNSNPAQVQEQLADQARQAGANAVCNLRYGQRAHRGLALVAFKWDTESWHGEGTPCCSTSLTRSRKQESAVLKLPDNRCRWTGGHRGGHWSSFAAIRARPPTNGRAPQAAETDRDEQTRTPYGQTFKVQGGRERIIRG
jgi:Domain of unknown function (DUF4177)